LLPRRSIGGRFSGRLTARAWIGWAAGWLLAAAAHARDLAAPVATPVEFVAVIRKTTETLKSVRGVESARTAIKDLESWRTTPMATRDEGERKKLEKWMREEPGIETALKPLTAEMGRIESIGGETYALVFEAMTGIPKVDLKRHFEELTRILRTISGQDDLRLASAELRKWGLPVFKMLDGDLELFAQELKAQAGAEPVQQAYLQELARIEKLGPELADELAVAMGTREIRDRILRKHQEALAKGRLARCAVDVQLIKLAIDNFAMEYGRLPWTTGEKVDATRRFDATVAKVLAGGDDPLNPRKFAFLPKSEGGPDPGSGVVDPWGATYRIHFDGDGDAKMTLPPEYGKDIRVDQSIGVESAGPDGSFDTVGDNVTSWKKVGE
jgi:hypothetical protein